MTSPAQEPRDAAGPGVPSLTEFLLARLLEQERHAEALAVTMESDSFTAPASLVNLGALVNPARVLADCAAKRAVVETFLAADGRAKAEWQDYSDWLEGKDSDDRPTFDGPDPKLLPGLTEALRHLAQPYADHPDFDPAWRLP